MGALKEQLDKDLKEAVDLYLKSQKNLIDSIEVRKGIIDKGVLTEMSQLDLDDELDVKGNIQKMLKYNKIISDLNYVSARITKNRDEDNILKAYELIKNAEDVWFEIHPNKNNN